MSDSKTISLLRLVRRVTFAVMLAAVFAGGVYWMKMQAMRTATVRDMQESGAAGVNAGTMKVGGDFEMLDQTGKTVTQADFAGQYKLIYFGYSFCPDVCPTELQRMAAALDMAGDAADKVTPIFVTIDPERDTPEQLAEYVPQFYPRLVGLTGTPEQVRKMADEWKVYYARAGETDTTNYLMDHSSYIYLMDPDNKPLKIFRPQSKPGDMAQAIKQIVESGAKG